VNNLNEKGEDSLVLTEDAEGNIKGTWSGSVNVNGKRINANTAQLSGQTADRAYKITAMVRQGVVTLKYLSRRGFHYLTLEERK
jgi:hypothetical protein